MIEHVPQYVALAGFALIVARLVVRFQRPRLWLQALPDDVSPSLRAAHNARTVSAPASLEEGLLQFAATLHSCGWLKTGAECPRCDDDARRFAALIRARILGKETL